MSKVLIDRELLERAVYRLELAYDADAPIVCDLSSVLAAPSGTPAMPVKAYYHEAPNEYGGLNKSVGLEVRKEFADAPLVLESDAMECIACLEGEIAKRDARIAELQRAEKNDAIAYKAALERQDELRAEPAATKAQGVVMPRDIEKSFIEWASAQLQAPTQLAAYMAGADAVARLNAAPVQQVSVQGGATLILGDTGRKDLDRLIDRLMSSDPDFEDCTAAAALLRRLFMEEISGPKGHATWKDAAVAERLRRVSMRPSETVVAMAREGLAVYSGPNMNEHKVCAEIVRLADISDTAMLAAAPAAPAADAWMVEALDYQALFDAIAAATSVYANGAVNISVQAFRESLAAHRSTGVV